VAEGVAAAEVEPEVSAVEVELSPEVVVLAVPAVASVAAELSPWAAVLAAEPGVASEASALSPEVVSAVAEPEVFALASEAELSPEVAASAAGPEVLSEAVFVAADVAEPRASGDIAVPFVASAPFSVVVAGGDNPGHPRFLAFPNVDHYARYSSSVQAAG
jgi:hypothetical protein